MLVFLFNLESYVFDSNSVPHSPTFFYERKGFNVRKVKPFNLSTSKTMIWIRYHHFSCLEFLAST